MWQQDASLRHLVPIPTYEEATGRPSSSQRTRGPTEVSDDAERQRFISNGRSRQATVESARNSLDSNLSVPDMLDDEHEARRQVEELDYMEPGDDERHRGRARLFHRARLRKQFTQGLSNLSATLGAFRLPSFRRRYAAVSDRGETTTEETAAPVSARWIPGWRLPDNYRISVPVFARLFALFMIASFVYMLFAMDLFPGALRRHGYAATMFDPESVREYVQEHINMEELQHYVEHLSSFAHEAGSEGNYVLAEWMKQKWTEVCQLETVDLATFTISANYPVEGERWVKIIEPKPEEWSTIWDEEVDHSHPGREQTLAWHAYSKTGTVRGPLVDARQGSPADFSRLKQDGVNTTGMIALIDVQGADSSLETALKVRRAQDAGCAGVVLGNVDPATASTLDLPAGAMPSNDSLHRSSVALSNWILGDPLTPGWASENSGTGKSDDVHGIPTIPSLPISWTNALELRTIYNQLSPLLGSGATASNIVVELRNQNDEVRDQKIWNLHATIKGAEYPDQKVIVGAPRDSWCFGASDAASASGMLTAIVAIFGELQAKSGWRPLRTIEFVSWDARTFNSAGSTEYVEQQLEVLRREAIAYINVESAFGEHFGSQGSPMLQRVLEHAMDRVVAPGENETMKTMYDTPQSDDDPARVTPIKLPSSDGDYAAFAHIAGIPVLDFGFNGSPQDLVKGSCYDTMEWLNAFGDQRDQFHNALVQTWALVVLDLVSAPLLPLDIRVFAERFSDAISAEKDAIAQHLRTNGPQDDGFVADLDPLITVMEELKLNATGFHQFETEWTSQVMGGGGLEDLYWHHRRNEFNQRIAAFEKVFAVVDGDHVGLEDRPQFRHIFFAPDKSSTKLTILPTIWEMILDERLSELPAEVERLSAIIREAGSSLIMEE